MNSKTQKTVVTGPAGSIEAVVDAPESVNQDAYAAWLFKLAPANAADLAGLLDAAGYKAAVDAA